MRAFLVMVVLAAVVGIGVALYQFSSRTYVFEIASTESSSDIRVIPMPKSESDDTCSGRYPPRLLDPKVYADPWMQNHWWGVDEYAPQTVRERTCAVT